MDIFKKDYCWHGLRSHLFPGHAAIKMFRVLVRNLLPREPALLELLLFWAIEPDLFEDWTKIFTQIFFPVRKCFRWGAKSVRALASELFVVRDSYFLAFFFASTPVSFASIMFDAQPLALTHSLLHVRSHKHLHTNVTNTWTRADVLWANASANSYIYDELCKTLHKLFLTLPSSDCSESSSCSPEYRSEFLVQSAS